MVKSHGLPCENKAAILEQIALVRWMVVVVINFIIVIFIHNNILFVRQYIAKQHHKSHVNKKVHYISQTQVHEK